MADKRKGEPEAREPVLLLRRRGGEYEVVRGTVAHGAVEGTTLAHNTDRRIAADKLFQAALRAGVL